MTWDHKMPRLEGNLKKYMTLKDTNFFYLWENGKRGKKTILTLEDKGVEKLTCTNPKNYLWLLQTPFRILEQTMSYNEGKSLEWKLKVIRGR